MQEQTEKMVPLALYEQSLAKIVELQSRLAWFERQVFGSKSERFVPEIPGQLSLLFEKGVDAAVLEQLLKTVEAYRRKAAPKKSEHHGRELIPSNLPRKETVIEPAGDVTGMRRIGEDVSEQIEYQPGRIWVLRTVRPRYVRVEKTQNEAADIDTDIDTKTVTDIDADAQTDMDIDTNKDTTDSSVTPGAGAESEPDQKKSPVFQANMPDSPFPKLKAGISLLVFLLVSKYVDHLPLYRIKGQLKRMGLPVPDSTLYQWVKVVIDHLLPLYKVYEKLYFQTDYLQMDETRIKVLNETKGKSHLGYFWVSFDPVRQLPFFFYQKGRDHHAPKELLQNIEGTLQCDGYSVYQTLNKKIKTISLLNCMAHIRREFFGSRDNDQKRADTALQFIHVLYAIEDKARKLGLSHEQRAELRQREALPIFNDFGDWLKAEYEKLLPASKIAKAIKYALNRWPNMPQYLYDGKLEIDNNLVENIIRPIAIGRKNYLFAGSHEAAQRSAMIYTFFAACKHHEVDVTLWLTDVLNKLYLLPVNQIEHLLPHNWKNNRQD
jgi:transposase